MITTKLELLTVAARIKAIKSIPWSNAYIVDKLKQALAVVKEKDSTKVCFGDRKYYELAHKCLKIGAFKPAPKFIVNKEDLSLELTYHLTQLDDSDKKFVLKQAIARIFEDVNFEIYHNSVSRVLEVELK